MALDTRVTDELRREGMVRDAVRLVQNGRKSAGLEVSDRIVLFVEAVGQLLQALQEHEETLAREVLAVEITLGTLLEGAYTEETEIDGERFAFSLRATSVREA